MSRDLGFEHRDRVGRPARRDQLLGIVIDRAGVQLGQPSDLAVGPFLARELLERGSGPQPERALQASHPVVGIGRAGDGLGELQHVDVGHHRVARARRLQDGSADGRSQPGDRHPQRAGRDPQDVGEPLRSQPARRVERQDREQPPLARTGQVDRRAVDRDRVYTAQQAHALDRRFRARHERIVSRQLCSFCSDHDPQTGPLVVRLSAAATDLCERLTEGRVKGLWVRVDLAGNAIALVVCGFASHECAEHSVPDAEDGAEVVLGFYGNVVPSVESWCDEDGFGPAQVDAEVAVVRNAVDGGNRDRRSHDRLRACR